MNIWDPHRADQVKYLVARFSNRRGLSLDKLLVKRPGVDAGAVLEEVKGYRAKLDASSDAEILALWRDEKEAERKHDALMVDLRDQQIFPLAKFAYWLAAETWTLDESLALVLGREPRPEGWTQIQRCVQVSPHAKRFSELRNLAIRAPEMNAVTFIRPAIAVGWARKVCGAVGFEIPPALAAHFPAVTADAAPVVQPADAWETNPYLQGLPRPQFMPVPPSVPVVAAPVAPAPAQDLSKPEVVQSIEAQPAQPAEPVEAAKPAQKAMPTPLASPVVAALFADFGGDIDFWRRSLADPSPWLKECRVAEGRAPKPATWNPVKIAAKLVDDSRATAKSLETRFQQSAKDPVIAEWSALWQMWVLERDSYQE